MGGKKYSDVLVVKEKRCLNETINNCMGVLNDMLGLPPLQFTTREKTHAVEGLRGQSYVGDTG